MEERRERKEQDMIGKLSSSAKFHFAEGPSRKGGIKGEVKVKLLVLNEASKQTVITISLHLLISE